MRNQLVSYIDLLFAGNPEAADIMEEILQNTLDRYDDMIAQGRTPEAAYSLAISGIGDISEILRGSPAQAEVSAAPVQPAESEEQKSRRKLQRSIAVALYILCAVPLFCIPGRLGLSLLLILVALATALIIFSGKNEEKQTPAELTPQQKLRKSINTLIWTIGTILYFVISFTTMAWHITWLIFPLLGAIEGLVSAIADLKEGR